MGRVEVLWLCDTDIGDEGLRRLARLPKLRALFIDNTRITDAGLAYLETLSLRRLGLNSTAISDASIPQLAKLRNLERLDVEGAGLTEAGLSRLAAALPNCQISRSAPHRVPE
jgi:Leucine-rich repeat (LRR) protein